MSDQIAPQHFRSVMGQVPTCVTVVTAIVDGSPVAMVIGSFVSVSLDPPLAGFFGKLYVFLAAIEAELYTLAVLGVLSSVVGAFYYLRIVKLMYFDEPAESFDKVGGSEMTAIMTVTGAFILLFFVLPSPILNTAAAAAASLFNG